MCLRLLCSGGGIRFFCFNAKNSLKLFFANLATAGIGGGTECVRSTGREGKPRKAPNKCGFAQGLRKQFKLEALQEKSEGVALFTALDKARGIRYNELSIFKGIE